MKTYTKIEIALNALYGAKELFINKDYISANILAGAGQQIVRDLCISRGIGPTLETISEVVNHPTNVVRNLLVDAYNKMKHAERDPDELVNISHQEPIALMTVAATDLVRLNVVRTQKTVEFFEFVQALKAEPPPSPL